MAQSPTRNQGQGGLLNDKPAPNVKLRSSLCFFVGVVVGTLFCDSKLI